MTTIAYRNGQLASDSLSTANGLRDDYGTKVWKHRDVLIGAAGSRALCLKFREWIVGGMEGDCPLEGTDEANGLIVSPVGVVCWSEHGCWPVGQEFYALGSGYQIAMGAMEVGATAEEAVRAAIKWDCGSGGDVQVISL